MWSLSFMFLITKLNLELKTSPFSLLPGSMFQEVCLNLFTFEKATNQYVPLTSKSLFHWKKRRN